jgi:HEAT repeat protein
MLLHQLAVLLAAAQISAQQPAPTPAPAPIEWARQLSEGWAALAAGQAAQAEASADAVLGGGHARHDATSLKIRARVQAGHPDTALDVYSEWSKGGHDDVFLLQPIAGAVLSSLTSSPQPDIKRGALAALASNGDAAARAALAATESTDGDATLAALGDASAVARLRDRIAHPSAGNDQVGAIDALVQAKAMEAVPDLIAALDPARPAPVRAAAAEGLGMLGAPEAVPRLKELLGDADGSISSTAALALARLGDQSSASAITQMETSPVMSSRLAAAQAVAPTSQGGPWVAIATSALQDPDPITRLSAAETLLRYAPDNSVARETVRRALTDGNPAIRQMAAQSVSRMPVSTAAVDVAQLVRMLRDTSPNVRIAAAGTVLKLAGGVDSNQGR